MSSPLALVIRDGQAKRIPGREVVQNDILLLKDVGFTLIALSLVLFVPPIRDIFRFGQLTLRHVGWCFLSALAALVWYEFYKLIWLRTTKHRMHKQSLAHKGLDN
ncbi:MAG: cation transporting ATPase C-terminal domain-containing protein [Pseudomonadota bacterium]